MAVEATRYCRSMESSSVRPVELGHARRRNCRQHFLAQQTLRILFALELERVRASSLALGWRKGLRLVPHLTCLHATRSLLGLPSHLSE
jgi:hypothetical protein